MNITCKFLVVAFAIFSLLSCDNEPLDMSLRDDIPEPATDQIIGSWDLTDVILENATATYEIAGDSITKEVSGTSTDYNMVLSFYEDQTADFTGSYLQTFNLNLGLSNSASTIDINGEDFFTSGSAWTRTNAVLTIIDGNFSREAQILELTDSVLELQFRVEQTQEIGEIPARLDADYTLSFSRQ